MLAIEKNKIEYNYLEIKKLRDESSALLQTRVKGGVYQHLGYDGIDRHYIMRPDLGIKYYLFGGNKYQEHIIAEAEPRYYKSISHLDSYQREVEKSIKTSYYKYWRDYKIDEEIGKITRLIKKMPLAHQRKLKKLILRLDMRKYLSNLQKEVALTELGTSCGKKIPSFRPILEKSKIPEAKNRSIFYHHPGLEGLIRYYQSRRRLGWLGFVDLKFKIFARPSYYPAANRTKMAFIGGIYLTMPLDILGAEKKENMQLNLDKQNILLKVEALRRKQVEEKKIEELDFLIFKKKFYFWKEKASYSIAKIYKLLAMPNSSKIDTKEIESLIRSYRQATIKWISARSSMALASIG
ncbi:hypothetical protein AB4090_09855 [Acidithiobacillus sp. IBUN Pt1247-S3]|uniref:hypothetical protein n=1 Tax=Acidithiobacillus sp. IBUN Pt1247-S3 TaxID=3166642 RepID=UPI0034E592B5